MNRLRLTSLACALLAVLSINGVAQQGAALRISGTVSPAIKLSLERMARAAIALKKMFEPQIKSGPVLSPARFQNHPLL